MGVTGLHNHRFQGLGNRIFTAVPGTSDYHVSTEGWFPSLFPVPCSLKLFSKRIPHMAREERPGDWIKVSRTPVAEWGGKERLFGKFLELTLLKNQSLWDGVNSITSEIEEEPENSFRGGTLQSRSFLVLGRKNLMQPDELARLPDVLGYECLTKPFDRSG